MRIANLIFAFLIAVPASWPAAASDAKSAITAPKIDVCFTPGDQCADQLIARIDAAQTAIRVQAYSFTAIDIADALIRARKRGLDVVVVVDKSQTRERYSMIDELKNEGVPVFIDDCCAIAHNKVMIIDERIVVTGSYNFTKAAELRNAENMLIIDDSALAARYLANWQKHRGGSKDYVTH